MKMWKSYYRSTKMNSARKNWNNYKSRYKRRLWRKCLQRKRKEGRCSYSLIREICAKWGEVQSFVEQYHPDKAVASRSINIFNDNAMCHFRNISKRRQKQITLDNFLVRKRPSGSEAESSGAKRQKKRKRIPFQTITFHFLTTFH